MGEVVYKVGFDDEEAWRTYSVTAQPELLPAPDTEFGAPPTGMRAAYYWTIPAVHLGGYAISRDFTSTEIELPSVATVTAPIVKCSSVDMMGHWIESGPSSQNLERIYARFGVADYNHISDTPRSLWGWQAEAHNNAALPRGLATDTWLSIPYGNTYENSWLLDHGNVTAWMDRFSFGIGWLNVSCKYTQQSPDQSVLRAYMDNLVMRFTWSDVVPPPTEKGRRTLGSATYQRTHIIASTGGTDDTSLWIDVTRNLSATSATWTSYVLCQIDASSQVGVSFYQDGLLRVVYSSGGLTYQRTNHRFGDQQAWSAPVRVNTTKAPTASSLSQQTTHVTWTT